MEKSLYRVIKIISGNGATIRHYNEMGELHRYYHNNSGAIPEKGVSYTIIKFEGEIDEIIDYNNFLKKKNNKSVKN